MGELADKKVEKLAARQASYGSLEAVCRSTLYARLSASFAAKSETPRACGCISKRVRSGVGERENSEKATPAAHERPERQELEPCLKSAGAAGSAASLLRLPRRPGSAAGLCRAQCRLGPGILYICVAFPFIWFSLLGCDDAPPAGSEGATV